jgi:formylglycine-generating enzyme required for sulfatase activity
MLFPFHCPSCQGRLEADASSSGSQAACPQCGQLVAIPASQVGEGVTLAGFRLGRRLGKGGMGEVFLARQLSVDREVAVKILPPGFAENRNAVERFLREGKLAARLDHANIATVYKAGEDNGNYYLAMAYIEGESLDRRLEREGALPEKEALRIVRAAADALDYAWQAVGLLHRDIKPANLMVDARHRVFLMDLGLAKRLSEESGMTVSGAILGTPRYMSPEQAVGKSDLGVASDVYSLGATLYHLTTGVPPFDGDSMPRILHQHVYEPLPPPRERNPKLGEGCARLLETMLAKSPEERYGDWGALVADIDRVLGGGMPHAGVGGTAHVGTGESIRDEAPLSRQAQEALARQRQPEHDHQAAAKAASPAWLRRPAVLIPVVAVVAVLLLSLLGVLLSRERHGALTKEDGRTEEGEQVTSPSPETTTAEPDAGKPSPPEVTETPNPPPDTAPAPEVAPAPAPVPEPVLPRTPTPVAPDASRLALERFTLPHTGNWALEFDEKGDVLVPDLDWDFSVPLTVEVVFTALKTEEAFIAAGRLGAAGLWLGIRDGMLVVRRRGEDETVVSAEAEFAEGRAMHAAGVWDGTELRLYLNGRLVARGGAPHAWPRPGTEEFLVSARGKGGRRGSVETVRVSAEACYTKDFELEQALPFKPNANTLCLLDLEEGEGEKVRDSSGNNHHGQIRGAAWRRMWPCPVSEARLRKVKAALQAANPTVADLRMLVQVLPNGIMLNLQRNSALRDISPLAGLPLVGLDLSQTSVDDLSPLRGMQLGWLQVNRWSGYDPVGDGVEDLTPLKGMPLVSLGLGHQWLARDLSPLQGCPLRILSLGGTRASDLSPLRGAPLEMLLVGSSAILDISPLRGMPLRSLDITYLGSVTDIGPISSCRELEILFAPRNVPPPSAQFRKAFPKMKYLNAAHDDKGARDLQSAIYRQIRDEWVRSLEKVVPAVAESRTASPLAILAKPILAGKIAEVLPAWRTNSQRFGGKLTEKQRQAVTAQLAALAGMDGQVLASFRSDIGRTLAVELARGKATCQIRGVGTDGVRVIQTIRRGATAGRAGRVLRLADLGVGEKLRRLGTEETPEKNLQRGMLAMEAGRPDIARKLFAKADGPLGKALGEEVVTSQSREKRSRSRREAERAGADFLQRLGCPTTLRNRARTVARMRGRIDGDLRRIRHARKLLADFEKEWGDNEAVRPYTQIVRQVLLHPWSGDEPLEIPGVGMELVPLAAGEFKGVVPRVEGNVRISRPFWLGKYEVTQAEFAALAGRNPSQNKGSRKPVDGIDWSGAVAFCRGLTERERQAGRLPEGYEFRLPTEAEWEYACRAGSTDPRPSNPDQVGWHQGNSGGQTHDVGGKRPNAWGLHDMYGNLWEWCLDWHDVNYYAKAPSVDPVNLITGLVNRCCRGGCWSESVEVMTPAYVRAWGPTTVIDRAGFRVCLGAEIPLPIAETTVPAPSQQPVKLESRNGWWVLFDGKGMGAWQPVGTWTAKGGLLLAPGREQSVLWTKAKYADYELDLEFRLEARGNSGICLNDSTNGTTNHARNGVEVQLLDDAAYDDLAPEQRCGSVYNRTARRRDAAKPAGEWNRLKIRCRRQRVVVTMNGQKIVDSDVLTREEIRALQSGDAVQDLKLTGDELPPGRIGLQSHTGAVQFRNIRLREL